MQKFLLGDVEVCRVVEWHGAFGATDVLFPSIPQQLWQRHRSWLAPDFVNADTGEWQTTVQTWMLRSAGRTVLIDTGLGQGTVLLDGLAAAGVRPQDVDLVINTHLHSDHVGGNTRPAGGGWVPAFPNARYLIHEADFEYWNPVNGHVPRSPFHSVPDVAAMFEHSVLPVHRAGQVVLWGGDSYRIDDDLVLEPAPGHTPGSAVVRLESGTDRALFVGDMIHSPLQMIEPDHEICVSEDQAEAVRSRRRVLERAAATNSLVVPAHFGGAGAAEVVRSGDTFAIKGWAPDPQH
ncbi:MBL fold metallo-hydrolase [Catenuloplanes indicus]|uniref:Glyoxylase-like metal-dependent hydrolase (Beta-lactamase superfamily II) n=1 Tax=Catenuloplanes indicus TaxID=137267 RepID=A0AAE4B1Z0_9ACTN|nr:MBL fold metallo-hydrolase [Catenuloplanes indicus]MDQ0371149.1 glyoxylase-like metal-dependent hydrolase (beta-lactamase superfamily II) [Catenuloplanes indicus]